MRKIRKLSSLLNLYRGKVREVEVNLQEAVAAMVVEVGVREWARRMGVTAGYASDIRHGRRKISDAVLAKILGE